MIVPSSDVYLIRNIPWSSGYKDVRTFTDVEEQLSYFFSKVKYRCNDFTYIRDGDSTPIRVPYTQEQLLDCNYLIYRNENFGNKWFFAFISGVKYLGNGTSYIYFEEDVFQTWQFDFEYEQCFVEREHDTDDIAGENTLPEGLELGPYVTTNYSHSINNSLHIYFYTTEIEDGQGNSLISPMGYVGNQIISGCPIPCYCVDVGVIDSANLSTLKNCLEKYAVAGKTDSIVSIFAAPTLWTNTTASPKTGYINCAQRTLHNGYVPKNNKLYTYPYVCLGVVADGQGQELRYELFNGAPQLKWYSTFGPDCKVMAIPINYDGFNEDYTKALTLSGFPLLPFVRDYYQNWIAQNSASIAVATERAEINLKYEQLESGVGAVSGGFNLGLGLGIGNASMALTGTGSIVGNLIKYEKANEVYANTIAGIEAQKTERNIIPNSMVGSAVAKDLKVINYIQGFYTYCRSIKEEYIRIIDDFFTMFGYATNKVKTPNLQGRRYWNYVKTINSHVHGDVPEYASELMESALNSGITFWHTDEIGNYQLDNSTGEHPVNPDPEPDIPDDPDDPTMPIFDRQHNLTPIQSSYTVTATFGEEIIDGEGHVVIHKGVDLACAQGTPIYSTNRGTVRYSGWATNGYGYRVIVETDGFLTIYAHMMNIPPVSVNDTVSQGQIIGYVGATGNATGPHVHVGVCLDNGEWNWIDPNTYIPLY